MSVDKAEGSLGAGAYGSVRASDTTARWFSANPSKAWGEKFFLVYSPIWMTFMGLVMGLGVTQRIGEWGFLAIGLAVALPLVVVPALIRDERSPAGTP